MKWKHQIMKLMNGATPESELELVPFNLSNWGPLLNHSQLPNYKSFKKVIDGGIQAIHFTARLIY